MGIWSFSAAFLKYKVTFYGPQQGYKNCPNKGGKLPVYALHKTPK
jgi:hypothetical protein